MFCNECGKELKEGAVFCTNCGAKSKNATVEQNNDQINTSDSYQAEESQSAEESQPVYAEPAYQAEPQPQPIVQSSGNRVSFPQAVRLYFQNYANFKGRATRAEYWWAFLFNLLVSFVATFIQPVGSLLVLALLIPGLSVGVRRLHDVGKSGFYMFMSFIPLVGAIILIVQFCKESDGDNQWGASTR